VWGKKALSWLNRAQKIGALAITGAFRTVATTVAEAEASILPIRERHARAAARLWINIHKLPETHPLASRKIQPSLDIREQEAVHNIILCIRRKAGQASMPPRLSRSYCGMLISKPKKLSTGDGSLWEIPALTTQITYAS
jgi:hypothetical protein